MTPPSRTGAPGRQLRDAIEPVAAHAFWSAGNHAAMQALGLSQLSTYVSGRAAVLGAATPEVVVATFAWFEPSMITTAYTDGAAVADWPTINRARNAATGASLKAILPEDVSAEANVLADAVDAASDLGRPLFAARRGQGRPSDPHERLWWACESLRDHRGDSHTLAAAVGGVGPVEMNVLTELWLGGAIRSFVVTRGWGEAAVDAAIASLTDRGWLQNEELTPLGRAARDAIENATDLQDGLVLASIGNRLPTLCATMNAWGDLCIAAGAFPADIFKRAAG
jgi:hypothetical protein